MGEYENVTLDMIYNELRNIRKELTKVEYAVIPVERLSAEEIEEHKKDLKEASIYRIEKRSETTYK